MSSKYPLDRFDIRNLLSLDAPKLANLHLSITNIGFYLTIAALLLLSVNLLGWIGSHEWDLRLHCSLYPYMHTYS